MVYQYSSSFENGLKKILGLFTANIVGTDIGNKCAPDIVAYPTGKSPATTQCGTQSAVDNGLTKPLETLCQVVRLYRKGIKGQNQHRRLDRGMPLLPCTRPPHLNQRKRGRKMATKRMPTGVVIRDRSIKIWFMYRGKRCWESLPLKPTTANIRHATKLREEISTRIAIGVFDYAEFFPNSKRAEKTERSPTFRDMAEAWLATVKQLSRNCTSLPPIPMSATTCRLCWKALPKVRPSMPTKDTIVRKTGNIWKNIGCRTALCAKPTATVR